MKYFAYGSNMSLNRIRKRVQSALVLGTFLLENHELKFHKHGRDDSGKCDAYYTGDKGDAVLGVLYQIDKSEKILLDRAEGLWCGYDEKEVIVTDGMGNGVRALTYYATNINAFLPPFTWYKEHVLIGAREANLPQEYIADIEAIPAVKDHDQERETVQLAIHS